LQNAEDIAWRASLNPRRASFTLGADGRNAMSGSLVTEPRRLGPRLLAALAVIATPIVIALVLAAIFMGRGTMATPADMVGAPVRAATPAGDRIYVLTSQWKTYRGAFRSSGSSYTDLLIDVWAFDAADAKPIWRRRVAQDRRGVNMGRGILGAQDGVLWILQADGLIGLSLADGSPAADAARIEAANPQLKGLLPTEAQYYRFDGAGLAFTAADGRNWRLAGASLKASPSDLAAPKTRAAGVALPAHIGGGNGTWAFMERGLMAQKTMWLGLLSDEEAQTFKTQGAIGGIDPQRYPRTRLWKAAVGQTQTFFGPKPVYRAFQPLPEGPEFLVAGLLTSGVTNSPPILLFKPDSVLVLHRDRLGDAGHLKLTRISGPNGKVVWTVDLPMTSLESVMPGETSVVLHGHRDEKDPMRPANDKLAVSVDQLVAVDAATGKLGVYGFKVKPTPGETIPASSTSIGD
jgi:outer membrane protein assembly factor BamB